MVTKEPTYIGSFFPVNLSLNAEKTHEDAVRMQFVTHMAQTKVEKTLLDPVNTPVPNFIFNVVTLINALVHCCLLISLKLSLCQGGWHHALLTNMVQTAVLQHLAKAVKLIAQPSPTSTTHLLDIPLQWSPITTTQTVNQTSSIFFSSAQVAAFTSLLKALSILIALLLLPIILWLFSDMLLHPYSTSQVFSDNSVLDVSIILHSDNLQPLISFWT